MKISVERQELCSGPASRLVGSCTCSESISVSRRGSWGVVAWADGMILRRERATEVGRAGVTVTSPRQEALLICTGDTIQVTLRTSFRAGRTDVAWIIPVPHPPDRVEEADDAVFARLDDLTAPRFYSVTPAISIGCERNPHCPQEIGRIVVAQTGKAGIYDYTMTATGVEALLNWLKEHSYHVPDGSKRNIFENMLIAAGVGWRSG